MDQEYGEALLGVVIFGEALVGLGRYECSSLGRKVEAVLFLLSIAIGKGLVSLVFRG
jgi:hypothetical protein